MRERFRRLRFGLQTVLGRSPRGFFVPYRHAATASPSAYPALRPLFEAAHPSFDRLTADIASFADELDAIDKGGVLARFDQDWFPRLDAAAAYALVRRARPRRIVEIGSGHSTRFLAQAVRDGGLATKIACIDPAPRAAIDHLPVRHELKLLHDADPRHFDRLGPDDILFIDSSHVAMPGTDVDRLFLDLLPRLPSGTLVHVHDVFLPDPYPPEWSWRGYNEQLLVGTLLQGSAYEIVFASHYIVAHRQELLDHVSRLSLIAGARETSLWLRKR